MQMAEYSGGAMEAGQEKGDLVLIRVVCEHR